MVRVGLGGIRYRFLHNLLNLEVHEYRIWELQLTVYCSGLCLLMILMT